MGWVKALRSLRRMAREESPLSSILSPWAMRFAPLIGCLLRHHLHDRHPRERGDPVSAGVSAKVRMCRGHARKITASAAAYLVAAFAGMTTGRWRGRASNIVKPG